MENITKSCLINNNISIPKKVRNIYIYIYISYILNQWPIGLNTNLH